MESLATVWSFLTKGGIIMIPLGLCSLIGLAIVIEKLFHLQERKIIIPEMASVLDNIKSEEDLGLTMAMCEKHTGPFPNLILTVLKNRELPAEELKELIEETGRQEIRFLERGLVTLETVAQIAPLLGLLGTVIGILKVFNVITEIGVGQAAALSGGISEALITTIVGLSIGIPTLVFYNFFTDKAENLILDIEKHTANLIRKIHLFDTKEHELVDAT